MSENNVACVETLMGMNHSHEGEVFLIPHVGPARHPPSSSNSESCTTGSSSGFSRSPYEPFSPNS